MYILQQNNKLMVKSKRKDVTKQGFCKITLSWYLFNFWGGWEGGRRVGGVLVGANSTLGTY